MGYELCGCNNDSGPSTEANLVIILIFNKIFLQVNNNINNIETLKNNPKRQDLETNSQFKSNYNSISQNDFKSINSQINFNKSVNEKEEVSKKN